MKRGFLSKAWIFCTPLPVLRTHLRVKKNQDSYEKQSVGQLHRVQNEEADYKSVFLQKDNVPSKHELPLPYMVGSLTVL